jgi:sulfane dehydrogenase subunit SoxC
MPQDASDQEIQAFIQGGERLSRRRALRRAVGLAAATALGALGSASPAAAQETLTRVQGRPASAISSGRSEFEQLQRNTRQSYAGIVQSTGTNQAAYMGVITPSDLHFERHHAGIPDLDPADYRLLIHGLVDRPMVFTLDDLKRLPQVSHFHFVECAGNSQQHWRGLPPGATVYDTHQIYSNSEWIGVPLDVLFRLTGVKSTARWFLAESHDGAALSRSVPLSKAFDDGLVAYGQNGEAVRPEQGYPARLLLPGWEGNINVKWLRRIELSDRPFMMRDETSKYTDPIPMAGTSRMFTFELDVKSVIVRPSGGMSLAGPGPVEIRGLAWSGRGSIDRVEVSTDGGETWTRAALQDPVLPKTSTAFRHTWRWDGTEALILSRATDEMGAVQPTRNELLAARGQSNYHFNGIQAWRVRPDGAVVHAYHEPPLEARDLPAQLAGPWPFVSDCGLG